MEQSRLTLTRKPSAYTGRPTLAAPDDTIEGYPDAYTYRLDGNDGVKMNVNGKASTTNGDALQKATIGMRIINGAWKIVSIDSKRDIFTDCLCLTLNGDFV